MKTFQCICGQPVFFNNSVCVACGRAVGFDPVSLTMRSLEAHEDGVLQVASEPNKKDRSWIRRKKTVEPERFRFCANLNQCACNWLIPADADPAALCIGCTTTRTIPNLTPPEGSENEPNPNLQRWVKLETAKRRLLYTLLELHLWGPQTRVPQAPALVFDFMEPITAPVMTGHDSGVITINIQEADDEVREATRLQMREPYRSILGHFRHEVGHYYWDALIRDTSWLAEFRQLFGDDTLDYATALQNHYAAGSAVGWELKHISAYAAAHPWEDWAESWAHYLHMHDTLETADEARCSSALPQPTIDPGLLGEINPSATAFAQRLSRWVALTTLVNELTRSMGQPDAYPFVASTPVLQKLYFIDRVLAEKP